MTEASYSAQERAYFDRLFTAIDKDDAGVLPGQDALPFLVSSGLQQQILGEVWALADPSNNGFLTKEGWYKAARLIGWLQKGEQTVDEALASKPGPLPTFPGHQPPMSEAPSSTLPPITAADRTKFTRIFVGCGPQNGLVTGDKARDVFVKSQLSYDKLGQIWNLADTQMRGSLDLTDFIIGMFLIQSAMSDPSLILPTKLPQGLYEQASGGRSLPTSPMTPQRTGNSIRPQYTGPISPVQPQRTGTPSRTSSSFAPIAAPVSTQWDVSAEAKATSDQFFAQLDQQNKGVIEGDVAVPFMLQSQLDEGTLATIWDLADIKHEGKLDRDQFAVAMYLINGKLAGKDVPTTLPASLIPPSLRNAHPAASNTGPSSATKDLFDLFDDPPTSPIQSAATAAFQPSLAPTTAVPGRGMMSSPPPPSLIRSSAVQSPQPQIQNDLLGDEASGVPASSAEVGNRRNELSSVTQAVEDLSVTRQSLQQQTVSSQDELQDLESKLSAARQKHETESAAVSELRKRVSDQTDQVKKLRADVISAESEVSALRSEKDELEQALLKDKEEVRDLQRKMKVIEEEKSSLKSVLEKLRKEARQQKGLVSIAKKQHSSAEASRDVIQRDIDTEMSAASAVPLPPTPQALSPVQTGVSQRSNNPFDRLNRASPQPSGAALIGAGAVAAAGLVAAGVETMVHAAKDVVSPDTRADASASPAVMVDHDVHSGQTGQAALSESAYDAQRSVDPVESTGTVGEHPSDPFGANVGVDEGATITGFGDSFAVGAEQGGLAVSKTDAAQDVGGAPTDFDSAFAEFDEPADHSAEIGTDVDSFSKPTSREDSHSTFVVDSTPDVQPASIATPAASGTPDHGTDITQQNLADVPDDVQPSYERSPNNKPVEEIASSDDEDEGPEDVEVPVRYKSPPPVLSAPVDNPVMRRSAPPPPIRGISGLDPFGVPEASQQNVTNHPVSPQAEAAPVTAQGQSVHQATNVNFDDDEFDFPDIPASTRNQPAASSSIPNNFDDDFAGFDDEFGPSQNQNGSDNSTNLSKSFEMVPTPGPAKGATDEWGGPINANPGQAPLSFDDAFGGSVEETTKLQPPLPQRRESQVQNDDIEDVKKLCAMGFSRTLVIAALDANGYDFQKALNVLLSQ